MRTRSPNFRNGVTGLPCSICSSVRRSARHAEPRLRSWFEIVPEPMIVPARALRVLRDVRDQLREIERHVDAGVRLAERLAVDLHRSAAD